jgi:predicted dehydrogenase
VSRKALPLSGQKREASRGRSHALCSRGGSNFGRRRRLRKLGPEHRPGSHRARGGRHRRRPDETSRRAALDAGAARVVGAVDDLPEDLEGLVVATPTVTHAEVTEQLIPYGVPIYVEKPLTCDAAAARHLAELAPDRLFVMHKWRYHPGIELLGEIARSGELGPVVGLRTVRLGWGNPHPTSTESGSSSRTICR